MNLSVESDGSQLFDETQSLGEALLPKPRSRRSARAATPGRGVLVTVIGSSLLLLGVLLVFTFQATSSYLPVFPTLVP